MTVATLLASGLAILSEVSTRPGARPGLLLLSSVAGVFAMIGVRIINAKALLTPWLALGALPALVVWIVTR
ncbi:MAG TPA: transcriptional regulator [Nocardioides sp.]|uniref:transcriptional regulator n=1 Tax=Nocardioides sp. TaxID=35761 RepID=UPI002E33AC2C|nr:transcriptional regulator [Nocardioides sp.]HEX3929885.1 transcriptional regulator [Nocardioides sp.]